MVSFPHSTSIVEDVLLFLSLSLVVQATLLFKPMLWWTSVFWVLSKLKGKKSGDNVRLCCSLTGTIITRLRKKTASLLLTVKPLADSYWLNWQSYYERLYDWSLHHRWGVAIHCLLRCVYFFTTSAIVHNLSWKCVSQSHWTLKVIWKV